MRSILVLAVLIGGSTLGLLAPPSPAPLGEMMAAGELATDLELAHHCNMLAMDKPNAGPLEGLLNANHAPILEIVYCNRKEKLKTGRDVRSWAYTHCQMPGQPEVKEPPTGAITCHELDHEPGKVGDRCCDFEAGSLKSVCFDAKHRFKRIEYRCAAK